MSASLVGAQAVRTGFQVERLVPQINKSHALAQEAGGTMLSHMLEAGRLLSELKEMVKHGEFEASVERSCEFSLTTARRYMKLFDHWPRITELMGEEEAACLSLEGACKLIEATKPKKVDPPKEVKSAATVPFDVAGKGNRTPDICPRGGAHEWKDDDGDTVCGKCCEPGDDDAGLDQEEAGPDQRAGASRGPDGVSVHEDGSSKAFASADAAFTALIRSVDTCNRGFAHEKLYGDVLQSLNLAYEDFKLWRKAFRQ
jgi:hypothetical protein